MDMYCANVRCVISQHLSTEEREMTLTKASQKRSRSKDEDSDILPRTKRREYNFDSSCQGFHEDQADGAGEPHHSQAASSSTSPLATSPQAGSTASHRLPHSHNSADIIAALHNTHLDRHGNNNPPHSPSPPPPASLPSCHHHQHQHHPLLLKDAGILPPSHQHPYLGPLPDVLHETSETYYCHVNRLLRSAHFERLKRVKDPSLADVFDASAFN
ncbi:uncharacterized protein LOC762356 [Strongylocentrotus purpuratus]|uniref:Uncharacterized protein n=1 Tax=Strongylocentrotus purpuratus TaxID=7668 RepID=A0A7M7G098_STRPU|nr:uncharacterized protein LOC762356 [Strongylocentrotus purpuratus]